MTLTDIIKDSNYQLSQFSNALITELEAKIITKETKGKEKPYCVCLVRQKEILLTPEEVICQLYIALLNQECGYPIERMQLEYSVKFGREEKRADIVVFDAENTTQPYIVVEVKQPKEQSGRKQMESYCKATGASIGVLCNGHRYGRVFYEQRGQKVQSNNARKTICITQSYRKLRRYTRREIHPQRFIAQRRTTNQNIKTSDFRF